MGKNAIEIEKDKKAETFGKIVGLFIDYLIGEGWAEDEAEALNMIADYVGKEMIRRQE